MARQGVDEDAACSEASVRQYVTNRLNALANIFVNEMLWFHAMRKGPVFLSVKSTVSDLKTHGGLRQRGSVEICCQ